MDLAIKFPNDADVIADEAARLRALSPEERMRSFRGILRAGALLMQRAPNQEFLRQYNLEQEELTRQAIRKLIARHGR